MKRSLTLWVCLVVIGGCASGSRYSGSELAALSVDRFVYTSLGKIYVKSPDLQLVENGAQPRFIDADHVVFSRSGQLHILDLKSKRSNSILTSLPGGSDEFPVWNPQLKRIFFARAKRLRDYAFGGKVPTDWRIYSCRQDGTDAKPVSDDQFDWVSIGPSCFGKGRIYFCARRKGGAQDVYSLALDGGGKLERHTSIGNVWHAGINRDASLRAIIFGSGNYSLNISDAAWGAGNVLSYDDNYFAGSGVSFVEDGLTMLFVEDPDRAREFSVMRFRVGDRKPARIFQYR